MNSKNGSRSGEIISYSKFKSNSVFTFGLPQSSPNNISSINGFKEYTFFKPQFRKIKKKHKNKNSKKYYKILCIKLIEKLNTIQNNKTKKSITRCNTTKEKNSLGADNTNNNIPNITNDIYSNYESEKEINLATSSSSSSSSSSRFNTNKLLISFQESFTFSASYNNLNTLSKGKYIKNQTLREETQKFLKVNELRHISSSKFSHITAIKFKKSQNSHDFKSNKLFANFYSSSEFKKYLYGNSSSNLENSSEMSVDKISEEKEEKSNKGQESNDSENIDNKIMKKTTEDNKKEGDTSDFPSILNNIMNGNINYHPDNQNDKSRSNDNFMDFKLNGNNNNDFIRNESIKKMMLNNEIRTTNNNVIQIKEYNAMKTENNKICIIF